MMKYYNFIENSTESDYFPLSLATKKLVLEGVNPNNHQELLNYISNEAALNEAKFGVGGYLETRNLYQNSSRFNTQEVRNIHLGIDVWAPTGSRIASPLAGEVVVSHYNEGEGNYGGTIILKHLINKTTIFTLFGHLSKVSLAKNSLKKKISRDEVFCSLGSPLENGGYLPHLHYQISKDLMDYYNDFPGVCSENQFKYFSQLCPNPIHFLNNSIS